MKAITDINELRNKNWLFGARRIADLPNTRGKGAWRFKGVMISNDDNIIQDFKSSPKLSPDTDDESLIEDWYVIKDINEVDNNKFRHGHVRHLEDTVVSSLYGIETRTAMEYCRINNIDIKKYFDLEIMGNWNVYRSMINVPIYSTIPERIRGKVVR